MSDISTIRTLIADQIRYDRCSAVGDGATREFMATNSPVVANSQKAVIDNVVKTEGADYTFDDDLGLTTFTTAPAANADIVITYRFSVLSDAQLQQMLDLEGNVHLAAALALDSIANSEILIQKRIKQLDFETDGPAEAKELRTGAVVLRARADAAAGDGAGFDTAEFAETVWQQREKLYKERLREGL